MQTGDAAVTAVDITDGSGEAVARDPPISEGITRFASWYRDH